PPTARLAARRPRSAAAAAVFVVYDDHARMGPGADRVERRGPWDVTGGARSRGVVGEFGIAGAIGFGVVATGLPASRQGRKLLVREAWQGRRTRSEDGVLDTLWADRVLGRRAVRAAPRPFPPASATHRNAQDLPRHELGGRQPVLLLDARHGRAVPARDGPQAVPLLHPIDHHRPRRL